MVGLHTVERPINILGDRPRDLEIEDVAFESGGKVEALEHTRGREFGLLAGLQAIDVVGLLGVVALLEGIEGEEVCHSVSRD